MHSVENFELQIIFEINSLTTWKILKFKFLLFRNGDEIHRQANQNYLQFEKYFIAISTHCNQYLMK